MEIRKICEYCGNTSGIIDHRGGCISCGAYLVETPKQESKKLTPFIFLDYDASTPRYDYLGASGGYVLSPYELREAMGV